MTEAITPELPKPTSSHRQLDAFIGKWDAEESSYADGQQAADPLASAIPWRSNESDELSSRGQPPAGLDRMASGA